MIAFRRWMIFWGGMDLLYVIIGATQNILHGKIPIYSDIINSISTSHSFGTGFPVIVSIIGNSFYLTLVFSGILLICGNKWGRYLSYIQLLPRLFFIFPSFFPLVYIFRWVSPFWVIEFILIIFELFKIYTITFWKKPSKIAGELKAIQPH